MAGAMVMQALWINNEWKSQRENFDRDVQEALTNVANRLEMQEAAMFLSSRIQDGLVDPQSIHVPAGKADTGMRSKSNVTIHSYSQSSTYRYTIFDTIDKQSESFVISGNFFRSGITEQELSPMSIPDGNSGQRNDARMGMKSKQLGTVLNQMVMEWSLLNIPIDQRVDGKVVNQMISQELGKKGINLPFQFGVLNGPGSRVSGLKSAGFSEQMIPVSFSASLFPNDINFRYDRLMVFFDDVRPYIIRSMWWMILISAVLLLLFAGSFFAAIYVILRQKKLSEVKTDFINNMTHEFKTPIATISLALDAIRNPAVIDNREKIHYYSDIIGKENKRMNKQVEHILQMALLDKENFELNPQLLNAHDLIAAVAEPFALQVTNAGGNLLLELNAPNPFVVADEVHLTNVLHNLLDNANKYSREAPEISVSTRSEKDHLLITVADKGIGMSADVQRKIFDRFYRAQNGNVHDVKGFGLGLAYVKSVLSRHGGTISVSSEAGKGSRFVLTLPFGGKLPDSSMMRS